MQSALILIQSILESDVESERKYGAIAGIAKSFEEMDLILEAAMSTMSDHDKAVSIRAGVKALELILQMDAWEAKAKKFIADSMMVSFI